MKMDLNKYKIAFVIGTRAELIKTFPVMQELQNKKIPYYFIHTGQHSLGDLCKIFSIKRPDAVLTEEPKNSSKFNARQIKAIFWNFLIITKIKIELKKLVNLKYVLYHGDTMTTLSAAIASSNFLNWNKKYKNVHLEGGLRSFNLLEPFPEEISRKIADYFSDIILAVSPLSKENVKRYDNKKEIPLIGNTVVDSAKYSLELAKKRKVKSLSEERFGLISIHRHENLKNKKRMKQIIEILSSLEIPAFFTMHDNTKKLLEKYGLLKELQKNKNVRIIAPLDYVRFIYQMSKCSIIIADGGSMQEESLIFSKPCIILRKATERQEGLKTNFQYLSNFDVEKTKEKIREYLSDNFKVKNFNNPYGRPGVSAKIVSLLK